MPLIIRAATPADGDAMWTIFQSVIAPGDTLPFDGAFDRATFEAHWFGEHASQVAAEEDAVVGMYKLGANHAGRGSHIASATYAVHAVAHGRGIGRTLVEHSLLAAMRQGFRGMQFNYVASTNMPALRLYEGLGFEVVGTLPGAFRHARLGFVDALVMFRALQPGPPTGTEGIVHRKMSA